MENHTLRRIFRKTISSPAGKRTQITPGKEIHPKRNIETRLARWAHIRQLPDTGSSPAPATNQGEWS